MYMYIYSIIPIDNIKQESGELWIKERDRKLVEA